MNAALTPKKSAATPRRKDQEAKRISALPGWQDMLLTGMEHKQGLVPVLGGRRWRLAQHYRSGYRIQRKDVERRGRRFNGRFTPPHGRRHGRSTNPDALEPATE